MRTRCAVSWSIHAHHPKNHPLSRGKREVHSFHGMPTNNERRTHNVDGCNCRGLRVGSIGCLSGGFDAVAAEFRDFGGLGGAGKAEHMTEVEASVPCFEVAVAGCDPTVCDDRDNLHTFRREWRVDFVGCLGSAVRDIPDERPARLVGQPIGDGFCVSGGPV